MPPDPIKSEIVTPPPNEPQPDREAQLDDNLSKLFDSPTSEPKADSKTEEVKKPDNNAKTTSEKPEPEQPKTNPDPVSDTKKDESENLDKPKTKEGWKVLRENYEKSKKTLAEKDQELARLKTTLADKGQVTSQEAETLKKEIEDLKSYRAMVDIQADPEFLAKFDEPITKRTDQITKMLKEWNVSDDIIQKIDYTDPGLLDRISDSIAEHKDKISAKKFLRHAEEINELYDKKNEHLEEYKKNYKTLLETKKKESFAKQAENEGRMQKHLQTIAEMKMENGDPRFEFLMDKVVKDPTNSVEVAQVENQNKVYALLRDEVATLMKAETPEERTELSVAAVYAKFVEAKARSFLKKIESLQAELSKVSKVSTETPKTQRTRSASSNGDRNDLDLDAALNNFRATL